MGVRALSVRLYAPSVRAIVGSAPPVSASSGGPQGSVPVVGDSLSVAFLHTSAGASFLDSGSRLSFISRAAVPTESPSVCTILKVAPVSIEGAISGTFDTIARFTLRIPLALMRPDDAVAQAVPFERGAVVDMFIVPTGVIEKLQGELPQPPRLLLGLDISTMSAFEHVVQAVDLHRRAKAMVFSFPTQHSRDGEPRSGSAADSPFSGAQFAPLPPATDQDRVPASFARVASSVHSPFQFDESERPPPQLVGEGNELYSARVFLWQGMGERASSAASSPSLVVASVVPRVDVKNFLRASVASAQSAVSLYGGAIVPSLSEALPELVPLPASAAVSSSGGTAAPRPASVPVSSLPVAPPKPYLSRADIRAEILKATPDACRGDAFSALLPLIIEELHEHQSVLGEPGTDAGAPLAPLVDPAIDTAAFQRPRPVPRFQADVLAREVAKLEKLGIIVNVPSDGISAPEYRGRQILLHPFVFAAKAKPPDAGSDWTPGFRVCLDVSKLNPFSCGDGSYASPQDDGYQPQPRQGARLQPRPRRRFRAAPNS